MHSLLAQPAHPGAPRRAHAWPCRRRKAPCRGRRARPCRRHKAPYRGSRRRVAARRAARLAAVSWPSAARCRSAQAVVSQALSRAWLPCCEPVSRYSPMPQAPFWTRYKFCIATRLLPTLLLHCHNTPDCIATHSTPVLKPFSHDTNYCIVTPYPSPACNTIFVLQYTITAPAVTIQFSFPKPSCHNTITVL